MDMYDGPDIQVSSPAPPKALVIPFEAFAQPYFVHEKDTLLLPATNEWRGIAEAVRAKAVRLPGPAGPIDLYACGNSPLLAKLMRGAGVEVPSPILTGGYDWAGQVLYLSQEITAGMMVANTRGYVLNGLGTGKTLSTLLALDYLILQGVVKRALVVAPKTVLRRVWEKEIFDRMPRLTPVVLSGTRGQRVKGLIQRNWNIAVINVEGVKVIARELHEAGFQALVLDELALYRETKTDRWRICKALVDIMDYAWGLTGAPTPNGPWDAYGQIKLLTPWQVPMSASVFKQDVAIETYPGVWLPKKGSEKYVFDRMQPAVRFPRSEVLELPPMQKLDQKVGLSRLQAEAAREMVAKLMVLYDEGRVKAANAAVLAGKLLQISSGAVYTEDRKVVDLKAEDRIDTTRELMTEAEGKAIVFVPYIHLCDMLPKALGLPGIRMVNGSTPDKDRDSIFTLFQDARSPVRYLVAHPRCMAHGLNLTKANVIIWYAPYPSNEIYNQANDRIIRAGQEREQLIYRLSSSAAENKVYRTLDNRGSMQDTLLELFVSKFA
jgi:hypothetical protein